MGLTIKMLSIPLIAFIAAAPALGSPLSTRNNGGSGLAGYDTSSVGPDNADCTRQTYSLDITSENYVFTNVESNANQSYLAHLTQLFVSNLPSYNNFTEQFINGGQKEPVSNTYDISGTLCVPKNRKGKPETTVQLLVHGIGFDSSYWSFGGEGIDEGYNFVRQAADEGYTTFRYDRL